MKPKKEKTGHTVLEIALELELFLTMTLINYS